LLLLQPEVGKYLILYIGKESSRLILVDEGVGR